MADLTGYVRGLIPGTRYRMVITALSNSTDPIKLPSIEFVTPTAPDLISAYTPIGVNETPVDKPYSLNPIVTNAINARADTFTITNWSAVDDERNYRFFCSGSNFSSRVGKGDIIRVSGISDYVNNHAYYDAFDYKVIDKKSTYIDTVASSTVTSIVLDGDGVYKVNTRALTANDWCSGRAGHNRHIYSKVGTKSNQRPDSSSNRWFQFFLDGRALKTRTNQPNAATGTVYTGHTDASSRTPTGTYKEFNVTISLPERFPLIRNIPGGVVDIPVFAYKNLTRGTWHNPDHSNFVAINNPIQLSNAAMMQEIYDYDGNGNARKDGVSLNKTFLNVNRAVFNEATQVVDYDNTSKKYYFTVARYKKNAITGNWEGGWLQSENSEPRVSDPEAIIWSREAAFANA